MRILPRIFILSGVLLILSAMKVSACTTFCIKDRNGHIIFGRNFDFPSGLGTVEINHRAQVKTAFAFPPEIPFSWTSKYGSISFNQIGREFPYGGMNEAGLVIEQMWHQDAKYPGKDERQALTELQWIQYQLDNAATVDEVIASDAWLRISYTSTATLHFLIADSEGKVAAIEFLNGNMVVHEGTRLAYPVLANCSYETSLDYKLKKESGNSEAFTDWTENSSGRFTTAANMVNGWNPDAGDMVDYGFSILQKVSQGPFTQWSIVYDITEKSIHFRTNANQNIRSLKFADFNYNCDGPALRADIDYEQNQTSSFYEADYEKSFKLINEVCNNVEFLKGLPEEARKETAGFGLEVKCE